MLMKLFFANTKWHLHDEHGKCYCAYEHKEDAILCAKAYGWKVMEVANGK